LNNLGVIQAMRGELDAAMSSYNEALAMRSKMGFEHGKAVVLSEIGDLLVSEDKLDEADLRYGQALTIQERLGEQDQVPLTKLLLARGKLLRNDYAGAVLQIKDSITSLDSLSDSSGAALGHSLGAMALAGLRRQAEAQREANQAVRLLSASDDEATRIEVLLNRAEVLVADTNVGEQTMQTVGAVLSEANKSGLVQAQLRARLMLAKATSARNRVAGTILLRNVGDEARAKGLLLIARQAGTSLAATQLSH
jgi:tetratricopeptide (TPR) repeat protein